jgi:hypothetical protein
MKIIRIAAAVLTLAGCQSIGSFAPQTVAGFEAGGILGAIDGATGAILARCRTLDGHEVRIAIDGLAGSTGVDVGQLRAERAKACAVAGAVAILGDGIAPTGATVHGQAEGVLGQ